jgi:hypothetical protein
MSLKGKYRVHGEEIMGGNYGRKLWEEIMGGNYWIKGGNYGIKGRK